MTMSKKDNLYEKFANVALALIVLSERPCYSAICF